MFGQSITGRLPILSNGRRPLPSSRVNQRLALPARRYGAAAPVDVQSFGKTRILSPFRFHSQRGGIVSACQCVFLPWLMFTALTAVLAFELHFQRPWLIYFCCVLGMVILVPLCLLAADALKRQHESFRGVGSGRDPTFFIFLFITALFAWTAAVVFGEYIYGNFTVPFLNLRNMDTYYDVNPSTMPGQQLMDASRIFFTRDSSLNLGMSTGFRASHRSHTYCVAPIASAPDNEDAQVAYDFWAVGVDCCSGVASGDFACGDFNDPAARGGLRFLGDEERPFFRLAVQQAESAYGIAAPRPVFLTWMRDPVHHVTWLHERSWELYAAGVSSHFVFQVFLTAAVWAFSRAENAASGLLLAAGPVACGDEFLNL